MSFVITYLNRKVFLIVQRNANKFSVIISNISSTFKRVRIIERLTLLDVADGIIQTSTSGFDYTFDFNFTE